MPERIQSGPKMKESSPKGRFNGFGVAVEDAFVVPALKAEKVKKRAVVKREALKAGKSTPGEGPVL
jgi:hypothetical protein